MLIRSHYDDFLTCTLNVINSRTTEYSCGQFSKVFSIMTFDPKSENGGQCKLCILFSRNSNEKAPFYL